MKLSLSAPDGRCAEVEPYAGSATVRLADRFGTLTYRLTDPETAERLARAFVRPDPKEPK